MDEGEVHGTDAGDPAAVDAQDPEAAQLTPRQVRARRRRRRRRIGTLVFVLAAGGILAAAYVAVAGDGDSSDETTTTTGVARVTSTTAAFAATYAVTAGVNVRQMPGTSSPTVTTVESGRPVTVVCVAEGEPVNTPVGPNTKWLRVSAPAPGGYVSAAFVATNQDLTSGKIPPCPAA